MGVVPKDRLTTLGEFRATLDGLVSGGIRASGGYERLRRELLADAFLGQYLPDWVASTRTADEAAELLLRNPYPTGYIQSSLEAAFQALEAHEFPSGPGGQVRVAALHCPSCTLAIAPVVESRGGGRMFYVDGEGRQARVEAAECPNCHDHFLLHTRFQVLTGPGGELTQRDSDQFILWPRTSSRSPVAAEVPEPYTSLATEAALILEDSPRASAALSRRCLQQLLREQSGAPTSDLYHEIEWVLAKANLPSQLQDGLHDLREIGNMAAHPSKSTATGDYLEVEPGEAEWGLDVLDGLFDFYFVQPAKLAARRAGLQARLGRNRQP
jgi:Domain of unknown function (DUF4145)